MIKYSYAKFDNDIIHIDDVTVDFRKEHQFFCIDCNERLVAHLLGTKRRHFRHLNPTAHDSESYLHKAGKMLFIQTYRKCLEKNTPYKITYFTDYVCNHLFEQTGHKCSIDGQATAYDLTKRFTSIEEEKYVDNLKPDIKLVSPKGEVVFIEICVTHKSTEQKINSGYRIIEIEIRNEEDLKLLNETFLPPRGDRRVRYYNFKTAVVESAICQTRFARCQSLFYVYGLQANGYYVIEQTRLDIIAGMIEAEQFLEYEIFEHNPFNPLHPEWLKNKLRQAIGRNIDAKSCAFCLNKKVFQSKSGRGMMMCNFKRQNVMGTEAYRCDDYYPRLNE